MKALILILLTAIVASGQQRHTVSRRIVAGTEFPGNRDAFAQRIQPSDRSCDAQSKDTG